MRPKTLQQRIVFFILIPVFFILTGMGWVSFICARNAILEQWSETAVAKLQKAAHMIDMRLSRPKSLLLMLINNSTADRNSLVQEFILAQLKKTEGVVEVHYDLTKRIENRDHHLKMQMINGNPMHVSGMEFIRFSLPQYKADLDCETISLTTELIDKTERNVGQIEVVISLKDLMDQISKATWWKSNKAFLIDNEGTILTGTGYTEDDRKNKQSSRFAEADPLEKQTFEASKKAPYGTIFGPGYPPAEISGYYHLNEAPWSLVLISPGKKVLKVVQNFRLTYAVIGFLSILGVLLFIRLTIANTTNAIKKVSEAAKNLANGIFTEPIAILSKDEVGELTHNFNKMTTQLKERIELRESMHLAMAVQQSLFPPANFSYRNLEISGRSVYCDATGGDYLDIIEFPDDPGKLCLAVGDVVGHGIGAALLMTTIRALLRSRVMQKGSLSQIMNDVNRLVCMDTHGTSSFVTLFVLVLDVNNGSLEWVRAGHEPAMIFNPEQEKISELKGRGLVLGLDENWNYTENYHDHLPQGTVILIGTDGIWDVENSSGERLGKEKVKRVLQRSASLPSEAIIDSILSETRTFRGEIRQNDDITLLVLKFL